VILGLEEAEGFAASGMREPASRREVSLLPRRRHDPLCNTQSGW